MNEAVYRQPPVDDRHADAAAARFFRAFFEAKNSHVPDRLMACFAPDMSAFCDATLGTRRAGFAEVKAMYERYMPRWGAGRSYPLRILGGPDGAVVALTNTPELFGGEIRIFACVDLRGGRVTRWVDYWDSAGFDDATYRSLARTGANYAGDFGTPLAEPHTAVRAACEALHGACTDGADVEHALTFDAVWEDVALKTQLTGRAAVARMLGRLRDASPFGVGARMRHVVGGAAGGGYEWTSGAGSQPINGLTAVELDDAGLISRATVVYDGRRLDAERRRRLVEVVTT